MTVATRPVWQAYRSNGPASSAADCGTSSIRLVAERHARLCEVSARFVEGLCEAHVPASLRRYPAGSLLYDGAWSRRSLRVLRVGVARMHAPVPGGGGGTFSRLVGPWEPFGGPWLAEVGRRDLRVEAATECEVLEFGGGSLAKALRERPDLATELAALQDQVEYLRRELEVRTEENRRKDHLLAAALERIPALEPPTETTGEPPGAPESAAPPGPSTPRHPQSRRRPQIRVRGGAGW